MQPRLAANNCCGRIASSRIAFSTQGMSFVAVLPIPSKGVEQAFFAFALRISSRRSLKGEAESSNRTASRGSRSARQAASEAKVFLKFYAQGRGRCVRPLATHGPPQDNLLGKSLEFRDRVAPCVGASDLRGISAWDQDGGCKLQLECAHSLELRWVGAPPWPPRV